MKFLLLAFILFLAAAIKWMRPWTAPSSVTAIFWSLYLFGAMIAIRDFAELGTLVLVLMISAMAIGALIGEQAKDPPLSKPIFHVRATFRMTILALIGIAYFIHYSVNLYGLDYSPLSMIGIGGIWTLNRYSGIYEPWAYRLLIIWFHPACLFGGIVFAQALNKRHKLLGIFTLFPALLCTVLTGARAAFIIGLVCWLSGYLATIRQLGIKPKAKKLIWSAVIAASLLGAFVLVDAIRGTQTGEKTFSAQIDESHISDYIFGSPPAFAIWFERDRDNEITWGRYTVPSVFEMMGISDRHLGTYEKEVSVIPGYYTNVYTAFRGLVQDFTFPGAILLCLLIGYVGGSAYSRRSPYVSAYYAFVLFSPLVCIFFVNGTILAWAMLFMYQRFGGFKFRIPYFPLTDEDKRILAELGSAE